MHVPTLSAASCVPCRLIALVCCCVRCQVAEKVVAQAQRVKGAGPSLEKARLTVENPKGLMKRGADDDVLQYYEQSALKGSVDAQLTLGEQSRFEAPSNWHSTQYRAPAQIRPGHLHYHGARGLPADADKAFAYYSKAAAAGESAAYSHLGNMYAQGVGVEQNNATALEYFTRGVAKDHPPSQNGLGYMHMHGHGASSHPMRALSAAAVQRAATL